MTQAAKVLVVEDEWIVARAVQKTLESEGFLVTGVVGTPAEALESVEKDPPDLVLVDIMLGDVIDGIDLAKQIRSRLGVPVIFVTAHADPQTLGRAADAEPSGFVVKPFQEAQLVSSVTVALKQAGLVSPTAQVGPLSAVASADALETDGSDGPLPRRRQLRRVAAAMTSGAALLGGGDGTELTSRELEVVRLLLSNGRVSSIAESLEISPHTVRNHLRSIFRKLDVHSQVELIRELTAQITPTPPVGIS